MVNKHANVYVCGDGGGMARDVHAVLREVLRDHFAKGSVPNTATPEEAALKEATAQADALLTAMVQERRYVRDIWS